MKHAVVLVCALSLLVAAPACKKPRKVVLTKEQQQQIGEAILEEAPTPEHAVNAVLDGKVELIGVDLSKDEVKAGQPLEVTWYWTALEDLEGDWKIFVHLESPGQKRTVHDHQAVGELYPVGKWKKGDIVKDQQTIHVAGDFPDGQARLYVGIFDERAWAERQQNVRMEVTNPDAVKAPLDGDGRIQAATFEVEGKKKGAGAGAKTRQRPRKLVAHKAEEAPEIDGKLDDPAWRLARATRPFVQPGGGTLGPRRLTQARATWDDAYLYVGFVNRDADIWNQKEGRDATLWEQDVVEIYLDPGSDGKDYVEIQVAPTGEIFDAVFSSHRTPEWKEAAAKLDLEGMKAKVDAKGSVNARDDGETDQSWTAEVAIPWAEIPGVDGPPSDGTEWAVNFYRIDAKGPKGGGFMGAWTPAGGDFHNTSGFGTLRFSTSPRGGAVRRIPAGPGARKAAGAAREAAEKAKGTPAGSEAVPEEAPTKEGEGESAGPSEGK